MITLIFEVGSKVNGGSRIPDMRTILRRCEGSGEVPLQPSSGAPQLCELCALLGRPAGALKFKSKVSHATQFEHTQVMLYQKATPPGYPNGTSYQFVCDCGWISTLTSLKHPVVLNRECTNLIFSFLLKLMLGTEQPSSG